MKNCPELIIISENNKGEIFPLSSKAHTLGRSNSSDICVQDPTISSIHCELVRTESGNYIMRDLDSTNGSKVNDKYVKSVELKNGDILRIGRTELLYSLERTASVFGSEAKTIIDLANVGDSEPIAPMANVSGMSKGNVAGKDKIFLNLMIYLSILLGAAIVGLILWLFLAIK